MNGFLPLFLSTNHHRRLLAFAVACGLGLAASTGLKAQEAEAPAAPPAIPSEEVPVAKPTIPATQRPVRSFSRKPHARSVVQGTQRGTTRLIPTGPEDQAGAAPVNPSTKLGHTTGLIPTEIQAKTTLAQKKVVATSSATMAADLIAEGGEVNVFQQVQAVGTDSAPLIPSDGLETPDLEFTEEKAAVVVPEGQSEEPQIPTEVNDNAEPAVTEEIESAPPLEAFGSVPDLETKNTAPARGMPAAPFEPAVPTEEVEEVESEPAPLDERAANSQPVPTDFNIRRTAAADGQAYNDSGASGFGPKDTVHTVGKGESFWTIAKKHYRMGRYSAALAEYNKSRIPKPDRIAPGMKVIVPPVETLEQKFGHLISGYVSPASAAAVAAAKPGFFVEGDGQPFYRVGEGDTLSDIARNHLGRSSRWVQIVGLNKERLPNPDAMKPGMVLRLPNDASEAIKAD